VNKMYRRADGGLFK